MYEHLQMYYLTSWYFEVTAAFRLKAPELKMYQKRKTSDYCVYSSANPADLLADTGNQTSLSSGQKFQCISEAKVCLVAVF